MSFFIVINPLTFMAEKSLVFSAILVKKQVIMTGMLKNMINQDLSSILAIKKSVSKIAQLFQVEK